MWHDSCMIKIMTTGDVSNIMSAGSPTGLDAKSETRKVLLYFIVSIASLATDVGLLLLLNKLFGVHHLLANPISFTTGAVVAYVGSILFIFDERRFDNKWLEFSGFVLIGVGGLAVNQGALWFGKDLMGYSLEMAKFVAAGASFSFNYVVRRIVLFS